MTDSGLISEETVSRARARVGRLGEHELLDWADAALPGMMRHLDLYRKTGDTAHLGELALAEMQLNLVLAELLARNA